MPFIYTYHKTLKMMPKKNPSYIEMNYVPKLHIYWITKLPLCSDNLVPKLQQDSDALRR